MESSPHNLTQISRLESIGEDQMVPELVHQLPLEFLKQHSLIPFCQEDQCIGIAMADPLNVEVYDALVNLLSLVQVPPQSPWRITQPCMRVACSAAAIDEAISHCYYHRQRTQVPVESAPEAKVTKARQTDGPEDLLSITDKAPAIKVVNNIFFQAVQGRASDIHIEPYETSARVRFRVDGVLHDILCIPKDQVSAVSARLKIMANLDIAERRLPQDGQSRVRIGDKLVDVRVSVVPTTGGERIVLRLLNKGRGQLTLQEIGFEPDMLTVFRNLIHVPHGIILLTGPTGSGKTTTLYAALNELNCEELNILTVEDPVEYQLPGIGQMQVKPKIDLTFANCLRHILRQDPDIVMIGEIRDRETAQIAIEASMTGHLVFSTLHTNDAASAMTRLVNMGIEPYLIASSVLGVMAQRLVRTICPDCKQADPNPPGQQDCHDLGLNPNTAMMRGLGCNHCLDTGYYGRQGIFELMLVDDRIRSAITDHENSHMIQQLALEQGMRTLQQDGLHKVAAGLTTVDEVLRVTQDVDVQGGLTCPV